jgi:hypothetical protein
MTPEQESTLNISIARTFAEKVSHSLNFFGVSPTAKVLTGLFLACVADRAYRRPEVTNDAALAILHQLLDEIMRQVEAAAIKVRS